MQVEKLKVPPLVFERRLIQSLLQELKDQLEAKLGEELTWSDIAYEALLHHNTVARIAANQTERIDLGTLERLMEYFNYKGLNVALSDFFTVTAADPAKRRRKKRRAEAKPGEDEEAEP